MIIPKNYILSLEMAKKSGIHIANFSMFAKDIREKNIKDTVIKYRDCTFINTKSNYLPNSFYKIIHNFDFTDFENCGVMLEVRNELQCTKRQLLNSGIIKNEFSLYDKSFVKFTDEFISKTKGKTITTIDKKDLLEGKRDNLILGSIKLSGNNYLVWY